MLFMFICLMLLLYDELSICLLVSLGKMRIRRGKITLYVEHPIPIEPPAEAPPSPSALGTDSVILALGIILYLGQFLGVICSLRTESMCVYVFCL